MDYSCTHEFEDAAVLFTQTVRSRKCRHCERFEVMLDTGSWVELDAYLGRRIANRSPAD